MSSSAQRAVKPLFSQTQYFIVLRCTTSTKLSSRRFGNFVVMGFGADKRRWRFTVQYRHGEPQDNVVAANHVQH